MKPPMDYRQFLQKGDSELRLPYAAGLKTCDDRRSWRLERIAPIILRACDVGTRTRDPTSGLHIM